jgi:quinol-cytochrome oxidoreductase complex cytochrome b subunit
MKNERGVAGLNVLLSVVTLLFVIGLIVMVFSLMGGELAKATDDPTAIKVINDTSTSIAGVTEWFPIIIVITAMVVLILLTVIIITAIRGSGLVASA